MCDSADQTCQATPRPAAGELNLARIVPNLLTAGNLTCGVLALAAVATAQPPGTILVLMLTALVLDLLDGRAARALGSDNLFGTQLDTLADVVSFGLVPAAVLYQWKLSSLGVVGGLAALCVVLAAASRLARFNAEAMTSRPGASTVATKPARFVGLAVTIPAAIIVGTATYDSRIGLPIDPRFVGLLAIALAGLMVSRLPYRSFKDRPFSFVAVPAGLLLLACIGLTRGLVAGVALSAAVLGSAYALSAPISTVSRRWRRRSVRQT